RTPQNKTVVLPRRDYKVGDIVNVTVTSATSATLIAE
nr:TRAM domain-containing protein [Paramuribaculum sp.]